MNVGNTPSPLRIWGLLGHRTGDNNQVLALGEALGGSLEPLRLHFNALRLLTNRLGDIGLSSLKPASRALLAPPWPDVVIGVGQRSVPVARWIRAQSGGRTRIVQIGRPRCDPARFDLVLTTPQYGVPSGPTVLETPISPSRQTPARLAEAAAEWREKLRDFPPPRLALILGGNSWPYRIDPAEAEAACRALIARAGARGGSVLAIGSRRTPEVVELAVRDVLANSPVPASFLGGAGAENAYSGLLALADEIAVTADSAAMMSDAVAAGKPLTLVPIQVAGPGGAWLCAMRTLRLADRGDGPASPFLRAAGRGWGALVRHGLAGWPRDLWFLWQALEHQGLLGGLDAPVRGRAPDPAALAAARIRRLLPAGAEAAPGSDPPAPGNRPAHAAP
ncbi:mitochondrial fission ELM1 family protein [Roseomonas sp. WA12]